MSPSDQVVQGLLRSLGHDLDRSIRLILDGSGQAENPRLSLGTFSVKHPLNTAVHDDGNSLYLGHDEFLYQGAGRRAQGAGRRAQGAGRRQAFAI